MNNNSVKIKGYTLVEVIVAMALLVVFFITISSLEIVSMRSVTFLQRKQTAEQLVNRILDQIRIQSFEIPPDSGKSITEEIDGVEYIYNVKVEDAGDNDKIKEFLKKVTINVRWMEPVGSGYIERQSIVALVGVADPSPSPTPSAFSGDWTPIPVPSITPSPSPSPHPSTTM